MRIGILSDIHGNLEALEVVLAQLESCGVDRLVSGGDVVGYGASPGQCIDRLDSAGCASVAGNHDWAAIGKLSTDSFNEAAAAAVQWTALQLTGRQRETLVSLPLEYRSEHLHIVHSSPCSPSEWTYLVDVQDVRDAVDASDRTLCMVGHSHVPFIYGRGEGQELFDRRPGEYELIQGWKYLVNVGSVGQPRDGDPRACYALVDLAARQLTLGRVAYPVDVAQKKIRAAGTLPDFLAWRLKWGF